MLPEFYLHYPWDVIRVKSYLDSFIEPTCVPMKILINKLDLVPSQILAGLVREFRNRGGLATGESFMSLSWFPVPPPHPFPSPP